VAGNQPRQLLETLRQFATLNSRRIDPARRELIFADNGTLFRTMKQDEKLGFSLEDIGDIAGRDKSTIGRQIKNADQDGEGAASTHG
jgi:hypothetical protein